MRQHVVRRPAVVEAVRPHAGQAALRELVDLLIGERVPLVDHDRVELVVVRAGAGARVQERHRLVQVVHDRRVPVQKAVHHVLRELLRQHHPVAVVVVRGVLAPVDERHAARPELERPRLACTASTSGRARPLRVAGVMSVMTSLRIALHVLALLDRQPVEQLHQHLGAARLGRVDAARQPVDRLRLLHEPRALGRREIRADRPGAPACAR